MQRLEVSGAVRLTYGSLGVKRLKTVYEMMRKVKECKENHRSLMKFESYMQKIFDKKSSLCKFYTLLCFHVAPEDQGL